MPSRLQGYVIFKKRCWRQRKLYKVKQNGPKIVECSCALLGIVRLTWHTVIPHACTLTKSISYLIKTLEKHWHPMTTLRCEKHSMDLIIISRILLLRFGAARSVLGSKPPKWQNDLNLKQIPTLYHDKRLLLRVLVCLWNFQFLRDVYLIIKRYASLKTWVESLRHTLSYWHLFAQGHICSSICIYS